jgi:site-specific DNA-methyltransferase (adenine-specific)
MLINASRSRDILECIASLSSDEVATPPAVANQVLDLLPVEVWSNKDLRWLDPACKTGVFLREAARRLMEGLKDSIPDETERRKHIFTNMLHGYALTELTAQMSRRSLYYNKDASDKKLSVVQFRRSEGNIVHQQLDHQYRESGTCERCSAAKKDFDRPGNLERHAYDFIHMEEVEVEKMRFDVVVGNPPYQLNNGESSAFPIYQYFVEQAFKLRPRYVAMIIPSRWFAGGKGLDEFRGRMLASRNFKTLVDFPDAEDVFAGVEIKGGVCYFLWDSGHNGPCEFISMLEGQESSRSVRFLNQHDGVFIRFNEALPLVERIKREESAFMAPLVSSQTPFGLITSFSDFADGPGKGRVKVYTRGSETKWVERRQISRHQEWLDAWKVLVPVGSGSGSAAADVILGNMIVAGPGTACTQTYLVIGPFESEQIAESVRSYLRTKVVRFLIAILKNTQHVRASLLSYVPVVDWGKEWNDDMLINRWNITATELAFIHSRVLPYKGDSE